MFTTTKTKAIAGVLAVFLLGIVIGALGAGLLVRHKIRQFGGGAAPFHALLMRRLTRELKLDKAQQAEVAKVLAQSEIAMRHAFIRARADFAAQMRRCNARLKPLLTPAQQQQLDSVFTRMQRRWPAMPPPLPPRHGPG